MLLELLALPTTAVRRVSERRCFKARFVPRVHLDARGDFAPGSVAELEGHVRVEGEILLDLQRDGDSLSVIPSIKNTPRGFALRMVGMGILGELPATAKPTQPIRGVLRAGDRPGDCQVFCVWGIT